MIPRRISTPISRTSLNSQLLQRAFLNRYRYLSPGFQSYHPYSRTMRSLSAKDAAELDRELMTTGGFALEQLMELAGLSVSQAVFKTQPPSLKPRVLVLCGP